MSQVLCPRCGWHGDVVAVEDERCPECGEWFANHDVVQ